MILAAVTALPYGEPSTWDGSRAYMGAGGDGGATSEEDALLQKLNRFDKKLAGWATWRKDAREARNMTKGEQWTKDALELLNEEDPTAYPAVFNYIDPMVSAISGAEITNRQRVRYAPREIGDVKANELYTGAADWARDECDASDEESQSFRDAAITGLGVTETRMDYDEDPAGMVRVDRIDPVNDEIEVYPSKKPNFTDAKVIKRSRKYDKDEAAALFPALCIMAPGQGPSLAPHLNIPEQRYDPDAAQAGSDGSRLEEGEVRITEYQWCEFERITLVVDPRTQAVLTLTQAQVDKLSMGGINVQTMLQSASMRRLSWKRCFRAGSRVQMGELADGEFTYKFITGKIDDDTGLPYGVVKAMIDPQRWSNKFLLQMDRIFATNAKGGVLAEEDAVEDWGEFEASYAKRDKVTKVADGAVSANKIMPKPAPPFPTIADRLLAIATNAVSQVTGVNKEMLGMAEREQAGVLEYQRKQAAFGVLAVFFDSLKRYRKLQGRLLLKYIRNYMSDGRIVRIAGQNGGADQYVQLLRDPNTARYDVIVDEAPAGPNQVERTWQTFVQGAPLIAEMLKMGLPPPVIFSILKYSPFPSSFVDELQQQFTQAQQQQQPNPMQQMMQQLQMQGMQAQVGKAQGDAAYAQARAQAAQVDAMLAPQREASDAQLKAAQAHAAWIESQLAPRRGASEAELKRAQATSTFVDAAIAPKRLILDAQDQVMNFQQAAMAHEHRMASANALHFDGPGFGGRAR